jgi:prepilin-type processing-associated H-X9-DG protein
MVACELNLRELSRAILLYAEKHDSRLPPADRWMDAIKPYVRDPKAFRCSHTPAHLKYSYGFNVHLSGASESDIPDFSKTIMLYEAVSGLPNAHDDPSRLRFIDWDRYSAHGHSGGRANFAFADGRVKGINMWYYEEQLDSGEIRVKP